MQAEHVVNHGHEICMYDLLCIIMPRYTHRCTLQTVLKLVHIIATLYDYVLVVESQ